ncbi:terminase large subunit [Vibrio vulnificus]|nr:terminase large subunit [Vibrio vulnificus]
MIQPYVGKFWDLTGVNLEDLNILSVSPDLKDKHGFRLDSDYFQGVEALYQYVYNVLSGKRNAGSAEIAACERFLFDLKKRPDLTFDEDEVDFIITIANCLKHPKGSLAGTPYYLLPYNIFTLGQMFGWYYNSKARTTLIGGRRFIKASVWVARGNAKTCIAAIASIANMLTNENGMPTGICAASVTKQARLAFDDIATMIRSASPSISKRFKVLRNEIRCPNDGKIIIASSEASTLDGIRGSGLQLCDEIHAHANSSVVDVLSTGMQSSKNPQMLMISTAGTDTQGFGREMFDYAVEVAKSVVENDRFLSLVYSVDPEDYDNWESESIWEKANPAIGSAVSVEGLRAACSEAQRNAKARANFLTKHLNIWCDFDEANFIDTTEFLNCRDKSLSIQDYKGKECYLGLDLAGVSDLSSLVYLFPEEDGSVSVFQKSYLPESALDSLTPSLKDRYYNSHKAGELVFTPTKITDTDYISLDIVRAYTDYNVQGLSIDAAAGGAQFAHNLLDEEGLEAVAVKQGFGLSESATLFQALVKSNKLRYNSNLFEWCCVNALVQEGTAGDIRVIRNKADSSKKIDACIAAIIGLSQTVLKDSNNSIYETQDFRFL